MAGLMLYHACHLTHQSPGDFNTAAPIIALLAGNQSHHVTPISNGTALETCSLALTIQTGEGAGKTNINTCLLDSQGR